MPSHRASDLLYESEAALRLVDDALQRMIDLPERAPDAEAPEVPDAGSATAPPPDDERRAGLERALLLLGELDAGQGRGPRGPR
jgi:hypothetical protein